MLQNKLKETIQNKWNDRLSEKKIREPQWESN